MAVIVRGGPTILAKEIPKYKQEYGSLLLPWCKAKAWVDGAFWTKCMKELAFRTRRQRGCNAFGQNPTSSIAFYADNCSSHSSDQQKRAYQRCHKILIRDLIPNATHVQQPVDQHVGVTLKNDMKAEYRQYYEGLLDEIQNGVREATDRVGAKGMREKVFEFAFKAAQSMKQRTHLLKSSWIN
eukprot:1004761_1